MAGLNVNPIILAQQRKINQTEPFRVFCSGRCPNGKVAREETRRVRLDETPRIRSTRSGELRKTNKKKIVGFVRSHPGLRNLGVVKWKWNYLTIDNNEVAKSIRIQYVGKTGGLCTRAGGTRRRLRA